jgi:hypothetical protein
MKHCPFCGADYKKKLAKCPNCGAAESHVKCDACGTVHNAAFCPSCGFGVNDILRTCPSCGRKSKENFCPDCGTSLAGNIVPPTLTIQSPARRRSIIALCVFVAVLLSAVAFGQLIQPNSPQPHLAVTTTERIHQQEGPIGDAYVKIVSAQSGEDVSGNDAVIVTYEWTNNSRWERRWGSGMLTRVYQNGVKLNDTAGPSEDGGGDEYNVLRPGASQTMRYYYRLVEDEPVYVECAGFLNGEMVVMTFDVLTQAN